AVYGIRLWFTQMTVGVLCCEDQYRGNQTDQCVCEEKKTCLGTPPCRAVCGITVQAVFHHIQIPGAQRDGACFVDFLGGSVEVIALKSGLNVSDQGIVETDRPQVYGIQIGYGDPMGCD